MRDYLRFYIGGKWVEPAQPKTLEVINPATEAVCGLISLGSAADVDRAVKAAREAFKSFSRTSRKERIELLERIVAESNRRHEDMGTIKGACCGNRNCRHKHARRQSDRNRRKVPNGTPDDSGLAQCICVPLMETKRLFARRARFAAWALCGAGETTPATSANCVSKIDMAQARWKRICV